MSALVPPKADVVRHVRDQRARTLALLESLAPGDWDTVVTPGWRVREVAAHLISSDEAALTGRIFALGINRDISEIEKWNDTAVLRWADRPIPSLLHALERWGRAVVRVLRATPGPIAQARIPTPFGRVSPAWVGMMRVYDEWIHDEDIRRAFGLPPDDAPEVIEPVARHLFAVLPVQTLPMVDTASGGVVVISYTDLDVPPFGVDLGARRYGFGLGEARSAIKARSSALVMVAAGRDAWTDAESEGALALEGDREPAEALLKVLRAV